MLYVVLFIFLFALVACELYFIVRKQGFFCLLFAMLFIHEILKVCSIAYLDAGNYNLELGFITWNVYGAPWYLLYLVVFFFFFKLFCDSAEKRLVRNPTRFVPSIAKDVRITLLLVVGTLMIGYVALDMVISGIPLFSGGVINRFNYWSSYSKLPGAQVVSNMITVFCVGLGMCQASSYLEERDSKGPLLLIVAILAIRFLLGFRVSGLLDVLVGFAVGYAFRRFSSPSEGSANSFVKIMGISIGCCLMMALFFVISGVVTGNSATISDAIDDLNERLFSLSGHMEWSVFGDSTVMSSLFPIDLSELASVIQGKNEFDLGIGANGLMYRYCSAAVFNHYSQDGVRVGVGAIASSLFYNGQLLTFVLMLLNAFICSRFYLAFRRLACGNRILTFSLLYRVFLIFYSYLTASGTLVSCYRMNTLLLLLACVVIWLIENSLIARVEGNQDLASHGRSRRFSSF